MNEIVGWLALQPLALVVEGHAIDYMSLDQCFTLFCLAIATISNALLESRATIDKFFAVL